jgi:hypothetical protein
VTTAEDYSILADEAYGADPQWKNPPHLEGDRFPFEGEAFQVVWPPPVSDAVTGFQATTVVPVAGGQMTSATQAGQALAYAEKEMQERHAATLETVGPRRMALVGDSRHDSHPFAGPR